jgi:hypothetical protein
MLLSSQAKPRHHAQGTGELQNQKTPVKCLGWVSCTGQTVKQMLWIQFFFLSMHVVKESDTCAVHAPQ